MLPPRPQVAINDIRSRSAINPRRSGSPQHKSLLDLWWQTEWLASASFWHLYKGLSHQSPVTTQACAIVCADGELLIILAHRSGLVSEILSCTARSLQRYRFCIAIISSSARWSFWRCFSWSTCCAFHSKPVVGWWWTSCGSSCPLFLGATVSAGIEPELSPPLPNRFWKSAGSLDCNAFSAVRPKSPFFLGNGEHWVPGNILLY